MRRYRTGRRNTAENGTPLRLLGVTAPSTKRLADIKHADDCAGFYGTTGLVLVNIREKGKSQGDRPSMVDAWRLGEPLSESYSDVIDVESTVCHR